jgi:Carboxypeptidase regulatory-like domain
MMRVSRFFKADLLVAILGGGLAGAAQLSTGHPTAPTYRISGRVVDAHTGAAIARCSVQIADVKDRKQAWTVSSDEDGEFSFGGLHRGKYSLSAKRHGYLAQSYEEHGQFSTAIAVGPALLSENLVFKLVAESIVVGTVTDNAGEPVRGAQVRMFEDQDLDGIHATRARHVATTDDRGVYELVGIRPGAYFLVVTAQPWYAQAISLIGEEPSRQARELDVAYPITFYPGVTDEEAATPIPVRGGERLKADITLAAQRAMRLRVAVPPLSPNEGYSVTLSRSLFGQAEYIPTRNANGNQGFVEVSGVLPGHYDVTLTVQTTQGGEGQQHEETKHFGADVSGGTTELSASGGAGFVAITGSVTPMAGKLPGHALIGLMTMHREQQAAAQLDEGGNFGFSVPPGNYEVVGEIEGMYLASFKATGGASISGRTLTVKGGDSPRLDIVAGSGYGEIEGIALRDDKPMSAAMVLLAPEDPKHNKALFWRDQSDSDGTFSLPNIIPGKYHLLAIERGWDLEWANPEVLRAFMQKSVQIEVRAGDHLKQSVQVQVR